MYITRETTPKHFFTIPIVEDKVWEATVAYIQPGAKNMTTPEIPDDYIMLVKNWYSHKAPDSGINFGADANGDKNIIIIDLGAHDTRQFDPKHFVRVQITVVAKKVGSDNKPMDEAGDIYKSDIIYLAVREDLEKPYSEYVKQKETE